METEFRAALIAWLAADPALQGLNAIEEESPLTASPPWLGIAASASIDWSTKDRMGREVRVAIELATRSDLADADAGRMRAIQDRIAAMPQVQSGFELINSHFLRARAERRSNNRRAYLLEYRFRLFETPTE
ncbi:tail completion protein gp17 [Erythrobacter sp. HA6-11]